MYTALNFYSCFCNHLELSIWYNILFFASNQSNIYYYNEKWVKSCIAKQEALYEDFLMRICIPNVACGKKIAHFYHFDEHAVI